MSRLTAHLHGNTKPLQGLITSLANNMNTDYLFFGSSNDKLVNGGFLMLLVDLREIQGLERGTVYEPLSVPRKRSADHKDTYKSLWHRLRTSCEPGVR